MTSLKKENPRLLQRLLEEFKDMSKGGDGGPYQVSHRWSTVRAHYYPEWTDGDFQDVLNDFENHENNRKKS